MKKTLLLNYLKAATSRNPRKNSTSFSGFLALFVMVMGVNEMIAQNLTQSGFTGLIVPQYMGSGTNTRLPLMFRATVTGLTASTSYRYYTQAAISSDLGTSSSGAGNSILLNTAGTTYSTTSSAGLSTTGNYGTFTTDADGNYTGWFGFVNTANAKFTAGNTVFPTITINNGGTSTTTGSRRALDLGITVLAYGATDSATNGSFLNSASSGTAKNLIALYDNVTGTGRPIYVTYIENSGITNTTSGFTSYSTSSGNWGAIIPNTLSNGVRRIEQFSSSTGNAINDNQNADGIWPTGSINTTSSINGTTAKTISGNTDAPLNVATTVVLSSPNPAVSTATLMENSTNNPIYRFDLAATNANATLSSLGVVTTGTYVSADVSNMKLWYQSSSTFNAGTATLLSTIATPGVAGSKTFSTFMRQIVASGSIGHFFITVDIASSITSVGSTLGISAVTTSNIGLTSSTSFTGSTNTGGTQTIGYTSWNGTTWSNGAPTSTVDAIINGDYTETADISCKDLTINSGKTLTIGAANSLTVAGNLVNDGNLIFKSTSAGTARFASYSGAAITSSNVTVERYLPARRAWRLLTAPLKGSTNNSIYANWQGVNNEGVLLWHPNGNGTNGLSVGPQANIWSYSNGWNAVSNTNSSLLFSTRNNAYLVYATGPSNSTNIASNTGASITTLRPKGELITGTVNYTGLTAGQFHLLGNPYASPIDVARLRTSNASYTFYLLDPSLGDANSRGGYYTYNGSWAPNTPSNALIQSGQGFFVKSASATTFDVAESHKDSGNSNMWFDRTTADTSVDKIRVLLYKQDNSAWYLADGILAVNSASGNHEVDAADADKMTNFNENLLFKNGTSNLAIEYRGLPAAGTLQPMQLTGTSAQPYELRLKTENYSNSNLTPYLENTQTGVLTAIPTDGSEVIVPFTGIVATSAAPDSRFRIVYQAPLSADDLNNLVVGVYPNPVHESLFTIELTNTNAPARYSLTNLLGQVVQEGSLVSLTNAIPVHDLSEGMYLLQINQEGKRFTTKLMIK